MYKVPFTLAFIVLDLLIFRFSYRESGRTAYRKTSFKFATIAVLLQAPTWISAYLGSKAINDNSDCLQNRSEFLPWLAVLFGLASLITAFVSLFYALRDRRVIPSLALLILIGCLLALLFLAWISTACISLF